MSIYALGNYFENGGEAETIPLEGDRGGWRVTDYPALHADDLNDAAYTAHLPPPSTAGNLAIDSGSAWATQTIGGDATLAADGTLTVATIGGVAAVLVDGSVPLTADWDAGDHTITADIFDADTEFRVAGTNINTGATLSNVAYLDQTQSFTGVNTFGNNVVIGAGAVGVDYTLTFDGDNFDAVLTWYEGQAYFTLDSDIIFSSSIGVGSAAQVGTPFFIDADGSLTGAAVWGARIEPSAATAAATITGLHVVADVDASVAATNARCMYIANPALGGGASLTNAYGLYIEDITSGTNNYAIRSLGGRVRIDGDVGIGIDPTVALDVDGDIRVGDGHNVILDTTTGTQIGTGTTQMLGFYGATPITQPTEITDELTTITHTAPGTPDYAIQDLTNTSPYGFVTQDEGNTALSVIANLQARVNELEDVLSSLGLLADAD